MSAGQNLDDIETKYANRSANVSRNQIDIIDESRDTFLKLIEAISLLTQVRGRADARHVMTNNG